MWIRLSTDVEELPGLERKVNEHFYLKGQTLCLVGPKDIVRFATIEKDITKSGKTVEAFNLSF